MSWDSLIIFAIVNIAGLYMNKQKFYEYCGEILITATQVEFELESGIEVYFSHIITPQIFRLMNLSLMGRETKKLDVLFLSNFLASSSCGFDRKIKIFKMLCQQKRIKEKRYCKVIDDLEYVRDIRNKVAHYKPLMDSLGSIKLRNRIVKDEELFRTPKEFKVNATLVKKVKRTGHAAIRGMYGLFGAILAT